MNGNGVRFGEDDARVTITLDDPDRRNPISHGVKRRIAEYLPDTVDRGARCVVFRGAGSAFSSGGDVDSMKERRKLRETGGLEEAQ